jgi:hypothetical protein
MTWVLRESARSGLNLLVNLIAGSGSDQSAMSLSDKTTASMQ